jgi:hypothetical protein
MEQTKEALQYVAGLAVEAESPEIVEICGKTYCTKDLTRYDEAPKARAIVASSLTSLVDYLRDCNSEFPGDMIIHITSPTSVRLMSKLDVERQREVLFQTDAITSQFTFDRWYDQERMMIELQANFEQSADLELILKATGNIEKRNDQVYTDDGRSQVATMTVGVAAKDNVLVPNPVQLVPYRTFQEVDQPASKFVFRIGDGDEPKFMLVEAENNIWKNEAIDNIKVYLKGCIAEMPEDLQDRITVIG